MSLQEKFLKMRATVFWVLWNLIFSNFISHLLPESIIRFAIIMGMPAFSALVFLKFEKIPIRTGINWGVGSLKSYLYALLLPGMTAFFTVLLGLATGLLTFNSTYQVSMLSAVPTLIAWCIGSLGEEIGWRGYLHNHLKDFKHGPLIIGIIWGAWHFHGLGSDGLYLLGFTCLTVFISYFLSWLLENGGTVLSSTVFHGAWNFVRLKILFGNPKQGTPGFFNSISPQITEMEGLYGLIVVMILMVPFIYFWYRKYALKSKH